MAKEYITGKSWVELMEEEEETSGEELQSRDKELSEEERLLAEDDLDTMGERLEAKKENFDADEVTKKSEEQKLHEESCLDVQEHSRTELKGKLEVSDIKVKTEMEASSTHELSTKAILPNDKIKTEPGTHTRCNGDALVAGIKQETNVCTIKIKSEVEEIDDDNDRISKELDLMENELFNVQEENSDSVKDRVSDFVKVGISDSVKDNVVMKCKDSLIVESSANSVAKETETHTFVHPETMVNGDHKASDKMDDTRHVSTSTQTSPRKNRNTRKRKSSSNVGNNRRKYSCRDPSASSSSSGRSSNATTPRKEKKPVEYENDPEILARRQKQIDYGKNTIGYDRYRQLVPKEKRTNRDPRTPPKHVKYSRRAWDGMVRIWRQQLHAWDPTPDDKESTTLPELNVSVDVSSMPYKRRIHSCTASSASGSTEDVGADDFISLDYEDGDLE
ncbi:uncharacterized protein LOC124612560 [Schistocerca americana]|uniref:uncharacterized protein LOC124612560 n=1 Tax=Schistocerca americana TaxID=7009 RepID=UPI001F4FAB04|nr:uncharacterized protein LOC124612560 [Schistocerca americana]XP_047114608.1 uncharacterized protein LOC124794938 [Schistocerca piceifrons]